MTATMAGVCSYLNFTKLISGILIGEYFTPLFQAIELDGDIFIKNPGQDFFVMGLWESLGF